MRRFIPVVLGLGLSGLITATASANMIDFTPFAGYTTVTMGSVDRALAAYNGLLDVVTLGAGGSSSSDYVSNAWIAGGDVLTNRLTPYPNLSLGLRGEYLATNPANDSFTESGDTIAFQESGTLTGFLLGGRYTLPEKGAGLDLSVGAYAGLGYATMSQSFLLSGSGAPSGLGGNELYQGEGFIGDLDLRLIWTVPGASWLRINAQGGYRYASLGDLYDDHGHPMLGPSGKLLTLLSGPGGGPATDADFSGLTAQGSLSVLF